MVMHSYQAKRTWIDLHENEAQSPWKKLEGRLISRSLHKNLDFSRLRNEIRMRSLVPRERNYY